METSNITEKRSNSEVQREAQLAELQRAAAKVQERLAEAGSVRAVYERSLSEFQYEQYAACIMEASESAERLTERLRRVVLGGALGSFRQREYRRTLEHMYAVSIEYTDGMVVAELPFLLPHRKSKYTDYIYKPLYLALQDWCGERVKKEEGIPSYQRAAVCFVHLYDESLPLARVRDHDNVEEKQTVDALGTFFLQSDSGLYLDTYHTSLLEKRDRTLVFLMEPERFLQWICKKEYLDFLSRKPDSEERCVSTG